MPNSRRDWRHTHILLQGLVSCGISVGSCGVMHTPQTLKAIFCSFQLFSRRILLDATISIRQSPPAPLTLAETTIEKTSSYTALKNESIKCGITHVECRV